MRFERIGPKGQEFPVVVSEGVVRDLRPLFPDLTPASIGSTSVGEIQSALLTLPEVSGVSKMRIGAPIASPGAVYCVGMNYAKHAREGGSEPPENIVIFLKPPHTLAGPNDDFILPDGMKKVDWEVELAMVVGKRAWRLSDKDNPLDYIFGFTVCDDISERHWQLEVSGGQWSKGKSGPGFLPLGPSIIPTHLVDPQNLRLRSYVNGETRQDSSTADMIFGVEQIIRDMSKFTALEPGDLILTGTPEGVALSGRFPYLAHGDLVTIEIDTLGSQAHRVIRES